MTGLSDHTLGVTTSIASIALGASIIEKHFTLDRMGGGPDDIFSIEPEELKVLCSDAKTAWCALGNVDYGLKESESGNVKFKRSLYFVKAMNAGELITKDVIRSVRPGYGLHPKYLDSIIGKRLLNNVRQYQACSLKDIEE